MITIIVLVLVIGIALLVFNVISNELKSETPIVKYSDLDRRFDINSTNIYKNMENKQLRKELCSLVNYFIENLKDGESISVTGVFLENETHRMTKGLVKLHNYEKKGLWLENVGNLNSICFVNDKHFVVDSSGLWESNPLCLYENTFNDYQEIFKSLKKNVNYEKKEVSFDHKLENQLKDILNEVIIRYGETLDENQNIWNLKKVMILINKIRDIREKPENIYADMEDLETLSSKESIFLAGILYNYGNDETRKKNIDVALGCYLISLCGNSKDLSCFNNICATLKEIKRKDIAMYIYQKQFIKHEKDWRLAFRMAICSYELKIGDSKPLKKLIQIEKLNKDLLVDTMKRQYESAPNIVSIIEIINNELEK